MPSARIMTWLGLLAAAGALGWGVAGGRPGAVATLVVIGAVLVLADAALADAETRRDPGFDLPEGVGPPPAAWWAAPVLAGLAGVGAGVAAGSPVAVLAGAASLLGGAAGLLAYVRARGRGPSPAAVRAARRVRRFAGAHGAARADPVDGYAVGLGGAWERLVVLAPDGTWGDVVLPAGEDGRLAIRLARVRLTDAEDRGLGRAMRTGRPAWRRMTAPL